MPTKTRRSQSVASALKGEPSGLKVEELRPAFTVRPEPMLSRSQYIAYIKKRWSIHQYEVQALSDDIKRGYQALKPQVLKAYAYVQPKAVAAYQFVLARTKQATAS